MFLDETDDDATQVDPSPSDSFPDQIGPYHLRERLGEGGMGVVFLAKQETPIRRRVALKIIKLGMDTADVVARFESERQALAVMDHPNIAQVFDGGATERGRPYFVMELVQGRPITDYCDEHELTVRQRLELFMTVCQAVQHAHQKGVIHRDLKPSNILVARQGDDSVPKVIDFGVAKATGGQLTDRTFKTVQGRMVGTPAYMSPEQAESGVDIDTRTDIYALGVVLYELLTGQLPIDRKILYRTPLNDFHRMIREHEPPRPSTRLTSLGNRDYVAGLRSTDHGNLRRQLRGDLDAIVLKALEKDRTRRYDTANGLAQDVQRFLKNEPIIARPPSKSYRMVKFVRRHRVGVVFAAALVVALMAGVVGTSVGLLRAQRQTRKAQEITRFLTNMLSSVDPDKAQGNEVTVREVLDETAATLGESFRDAPEIEAELRETIGRMYDQLGFHAEAEPHLLRSVDLYWAEFGEEHAATSKARTTLATNYFYQRRNTEAEGIFRDVLEIRLRVDGEDDPVTLTAGQNLASILLQQEKFEEAEPILRNVLERRARVLGDTDVKTTATMSNLGWLYQKTERYEDAEPLFERILEIRRELLGDTHPRTLFVVHNLGSLYNVMNRYAEAEPLLAEAVEGFDKVYDRKHKNTVSAMADLAEARLARGGGDAAMEMAEEAYDGLAAFLGPDHADTQRLARVVVEYFETDGDQERAAVWRARLPG